VESVFTIPWKRCSPSRGIRTRIALRSFKSRKEVTKSQSTARFAVSKLSVTNGIGEGKRWTTKISADNEVDESRLLLFKAHAVVTIAAATAVSETPSHPQFMHDALDLEAAWVMEAIDRLDEYLSSGGRPRAGSPRPMP
jgi:hypothetical protein